MRSVSAAVVGTGFIGPVHVEAIRRLGHRVIGVLGSSAEKSRAAADAQGIEKGYASFADLLADTAVEVVHLASPNAAHFDQCRKAIAAVAPPFVVIALPSPEVNMFSVRPRRSPSWPSL